MKKRLSERLQKVYEHLYPGLNVWDFCCDHGYLGCAAYKSGRFEKIYFVDQVETIIDNLKNRFLKFAYQESNLTEVLFLCQSGQSLSIEVTGTICITGVGGLTIYLILNGLLESENLNAKRIILGPHRDNEKLLNLISKNSKLEKYRLIATEMTQEDHRIRKIYIFENTLIK